MPEPELSPATSSQKAKSFLVLLPLLFLVLLILAWFNLNQNLPKSIKQVFEYEPGHPCPLSGVQSSTQEFPFIGIVSKLTGRQPETYQIDPCILPTPTPTTYYVCDIGEEACIDGLWSTCDESRLAWIGDPNRPCGSVICTPGAQQCENGLWSVCDSSGLAWIGDPNRPCGGYDNKYDFNYDGNIDYNDVIASLANFSPSCTGDQCFFDYNQDNKVDSQDFTDLLAHWYNKSN